MNLLTFDEILAQVDAMFTPTRRKAALDWANTAEGREALAEQRRILRECSPMPWDTTPFPADVEL